MAETVESVKHVEGFLRSHADKTSAPEMRALLIKHADALRIASENLIRLKCLTSALPPDLGNIYDLPTELQGELSVAKTDELEDQLVTVINAHGGEASLDQILVGLYRKFGVIQKRRFIQNKLYRMDMIWSVEGKKGVYTTGKPDVAIDTGNQYSPDAAPQTEDINEVPF